AAADLVEALLHLLETLLIERRAVEIGPALAERVEIMQQAGEEDCLAVAAQADDAEWNRGGVGILIDVKVRHADFGARWIGADEDRPAVRVELLRKGRDVVQAERTTHPALRLRSPPAQLS